MTAQPKVAELEGSQPIVGEKTVNLALQGGGSHGAFTWGVLDRLLEDERIGFDGVTATSAGGVNAVVLADGLALNGREGARERLRSFWKKMSEVASSSFIAPSVSRPDEPKFRPRPNAELRVYRHAQPHLVALSAQSVRHQSVARPAQRRSRISIACASKK